MQNEDGIKATKQLYKCTQINTSSVQIYKYEYKTKHANITMKNLQIQV